MNCRDLMCNIRDTYKDCDDRLEKAYLGEFDNNYSPSKLDKIWDCIQENHIFAKAPELGNIFKYMNMVGITRNKDKGLFYSRCTQLIPELDLNNKQMIDADGELMFVECGTKYSLNSKFCPRCNFKANIEKAVNNTREIIKCNVLPGDLRVLNQLCAICKKYQNNSSVMGSKCSAWGSDDEYKKSGKDCKNCPCFVCCNEKPMKGWQRDNLEKLIKSV